MPRGPPPQDQRYFPYPTFLTFRPHHSTISFPITSSLYLSLSLSLCEFAPTHLLQFLSISLIREHHLMASTFWFILSLAMALATSPSHSYSSSSSQLKLAASTISAAPTVLPDSPLASPPELSPDISPLFPSPGGSVPSPTGPTIPSSPSPPNPDNMATSAPSGSALSPSPSQPMSSSTSLYLAGLSNSLLSLGLLLFWSFWFVQLSAK